MKLLLVIILNAVSILFFTAIKWYLVSIFFFGFNIWCLVKLIQSIYDDLFK